jgi:aquaporin Z
MNRPLAEALGAFCLVFAGTGAIVVNQSIEGAVTHVGVALTFGLVVMAMIHAFGDTSGAHLNPAVTAAFALARRRPARQAPPTTPNPRSSRPLPRPPPPSPPPRRRRSRR